MIIIPAIDILGGKCVRLYQGDYNKSKIYSEDPPQMALKWQAQGASILHIVDLDGAKTGKPVNTRIISTIVRKIRVQVGGGIRDRQTIKRYLKAGVFRIVLGTAVLEDFEFAKATFQEFGNKIVVGLDAKNGFLMKKGWITKSYLNVFKTAKKLEELGAKRFIYTDISKDGSLTGPNFSALEKLIETVNSPVIASGGVSSVNQIKQLKNSGAEAVILGKALYEGKIDLKEALNVS
ncbi:1-(5-phosphoribosyl)-5-[(5-phosphoribosylamino)methylideneamino]imidazole-4-carboxamide isomerase [Candidatus Daviesbacteria bacterium]|nr:1-(5-phosphoribosyl)-5-[(5-phosphoribosylamino)methylideneamino]imidazole-4-carboxamide isomerase [Candidatus Daviesbacteria bacterium]